MVFGGPFDHSHASSFSHVAATRVARDTTGDKALPHWVSIDALGLSVDRIRLEQAIILAGPSGWVKLEGSPPERLSITASGIETLQQGSV